MTIEYCEQMPPGRQRRRRESRWAILGRIQRDNPCRRPDWRWNWADDFVQLGHPIPKRMDPVLATAVQMHRALRHGEPPHSLSRLAPLYANLLAAHAVYMADGLQRAELEARVLAGQSDVQIAALVGLSVRAVELYATMFFDVRGRLKSSDWVHCFAVYRPGRYEPATIDIGQAWRAIGFHAGPTVLDLVIATVKQPADLTVGLGRCNLQTDEGRLTTRARLMVASMILEMSPQVAEELVRSRALIVQIESELRASAPANVVETLFRQALAARSAASAAASSVVAEKAACVAPDVQSESGGNAADAANREAA